MNAKCFTLGLSTVIVGIGVTAGGALATKYALEGIIDSSKSPEGKVEVLNAIGLVTGPMAITTGINVAGFGTNIIMRSFGQVKG